MGVSSHNSKDGNARSNTKEDTPISSRMRRSDASVRRDVIGVASVSPWSGWNHRGPKQLDATSVAMMDRTGRVRRSLSVFCPQDDAARAMSGCLSSDACVSFIHPTPEKSGLVVCDHRPPRSSKFAPFDAPDAHGIALRVPVGAVMVSVSCARPDVRLNGIESVLEREEVIVVDRFGVPLGMVEMGAHRTTKRSHAEVCAGEVMRPVATLGEADRLAKALGIMSAWSLASVCVVSAEQTVVGMLRREHAARWLAERAP
jgi:hypothetical protein